jgi:tRNA threonylcarbamoyladenosine biosynthesis protein TsaE
VIDFVRTSRSEAETALIGAALGRLLRAGDVILIDGMLGAGKTTLIRSIAASMGLDTGAVASPTFVLMHEYTRVGGGSIDRPELIHVDAYRLRGADDLESLGWDTVVARIQDRPTAALLVEWAERLGASAGGSPDPAHLRIEHLDETSRELNFTVPDSWRLRPGFGDLAARRATTCPVTGVPVPADSPTYPFASERARLADLYRWFSGSYSVSRDANEADFDEPSPDRSG